MYPVEFAGHTDQINKQNKTSQFQFCQLAELEYTH